MITRIRDVRRAKGLTLEEVAARCDPPTTAQTIGRLETGTRTVSVKWLNRIADALGVTGAELVELGSEAAVAVAAILGPDGARAPTRPQRFAAPLATAALVGVRVTASVGDYRSGDALWCERIGPEALGRALNRDVLVPRAGGRFVFGRLIALTAERLTILPPAPGARQQVVPVPPWAAVAARLVRDL